MKVYLQYRCCCIAWCWCWMILYMTKIKKWSRSLLMWWNKEAYWLHVYVSVLYWLVAICISKFKVLDFATAAHIPQNKPVCLSSCLKLFEPSLCNGRSKFMQRLLDLRLRQNLSLKSFELGCLFVVNNLLPSNFWYSTQGSFKPEGVVWPWHNVI